MKIMKKNHFEHRTMSRLIALSSISGPSRFYYREKIITLNRNSVAQVKKIQIEVLKDEIKSVVLEKHEFDIRDESLF